MIRASCSSRAFATETAFVSEHSRSKLAKLRESAQKISMREHQTAAAKADFLEHGANSKLYKEQKNKNRPSLERLSRGSRGSRDSD